LFSVSFFRWNSVAILAQYLSQCFSRVFPSLEVFAMVKATDTAGKSKSTHGRYGVNKRIQTNKNITKLIIVKTMKIMWNKVSIDYESSNWLNAPEQGFVKSSDKQKMIWKSIFSFLFFATIPHCTKSRPICVCVGCWRCARVPHRPVHI
jgi:hypothetical protein